MILPKRESLKNATTLHKEAEIYGEQRAKVFLKDWPPSEKPTYHNYRNQEGGSKCRSFDTDR